MRSGCLEVSDVLVSLAESLSFSLWALLTLVADNVNLSPVPRNAQCVVLHAWTSPNVTNDQDLDMFILEFLCGMVPCRNESIQGPGEGADAVV